MFEASQLNGSQLPPKPKSIKQVARTGRELVNEIQISGFERLNSMHNKQQSNAGLQNKQVAQGLNNSHVKTKSFANNLINIQETEQIDDTSPKNVGVSHTNQKMSMSPVTTPTKERRINMDEDSAIKISKNLITPHLQNQVNHIVVGAFGAALETQQHTQANNQFDFVEQSDTDDSEEANPVEVSAMFSRFDTKSIKNRFIRKLMTQLKINGDLGNNGYFWLHSIIQNIPIIKSQDFDNFEDYDDRDISILKISEAIAQGHSVNMAELGYDKFGIELDSDNMKFRITQIPEQDCAELDRSSHMRETDRDISHLYREFQVDDIEIDEVSI